MARRRLAKYDSQLKTLFGTFSRNINSTKFAKADCLYVSWDIDCSVPICSNFLSELAESKLTDGETIFVSISGAHPTERDGVYIIKDALHYNGLPCLATIPIARNEYEFLEWYSTVTTTGFSLKNKIRFQRTDFIWVKQAIYMEIESGNYWYFDYFHKDNKRHYEVFNPQGLHIGEADEKGNIVAGTIDANKRIDHIIH